MLIADLLSRLQGEHIDVHLKNGLKFSGELEEFDNHMNVILRSPKDLS